MKYMASERERDVVVVADSTYGWPEDMWLSDPPELFIALGDLHAADVQPLAEVAPVMGVYGNHDRHGYLDHERCVDLSQGGAVGVGTIGSTRIVGVSGCVKYKDEPDILFTQSEYAAALDPIIGPVDLLITHCPPRGCNDHDDPAHEGIDALARLVERCAPRLILHGHTYPDPPREQFAGSQVLYVHGCWRGNLVV